MRAPPSEACTYSRNPGGHTRPRPPNQWGLAHLTPHGPRRGDVGSAPVWLCTQCDMSDSTRNCKPRPTPSRNASLAPSPIQISGETESRSAGLAARPPPTAVTDAQLQVIPDYHSLQRATRGDTTALMAWDPLTSPEIASKHSSISHLRLRILLNPAQTWEQAGLAEEVLRSGHVLRYSERRRGHS